MIYTKTPDFHFYHEIGKNFLCLHQIYNHIPGNNYLTKIHLLAESFEYSIINQIINKVLSIAIILICLISPFQNA